MVRFVLVTHDQFAVHATRKWVLRVVGLCGLAFPVGWSGMSQCSTLIRNNFFCRHRAVPRAVDFVTARREGSYCNVQYFLLTRKRRSFTWSRKLLHLYVHHCFCSIVTHDRADPKHVNAVPRRHFEETLHVVFSGLAGTPSNMLCLRRFQKGFSFFLYAQHIGVTLSRKPCFVPLYSSPSLPFHQDSYCNLKMFCPVAKLFFFAWVRL